MIKEVKTTRYIDDKENTEYVFRPIDDTISIEKTKDGYTVKYLVQDKQPMSPDEWDDGTVFLVHYHRDFWIENELCSKEILGHIYTGNDSEYDKNGAVELLKKYHCFEVSALIHSGVWLSLHKNFVFDPGGWDTSHVGAIFVKKAEYGSGGVQFEHSREEAATMAEDQIKAWNQYLSGDIYCCVVEKWDKDKQPVSYNVVGGYSGFDYAKECLASEF